MSNEAAPMPEPLGAKRERLARRISRNQALYDAVGTGEVQALDCAEAALKIGRLRSRIHLALERDQEGMRILQQQTGEELTDKATKFLKERQKRAADLQEMKILADQGHLSSGVVEHYEEQFKNYLEALIPKEDGSNNIFIEAVREVERKQNSNFGRLEASIAELPEARGTGTSWTAFWDKNFRDYGNEALTSLLPREISRNTFLLSRTIYTLGRRKDITTRAQLAVLSEKDLKRIPRLGKRSFELIKILRDLI
ncbi:hypothetical protein M1403_04110 [Patescibacteria group bacterium]|nr:hypothetical protein [Patescibacteria group bacterium]